MDTPNIIEKSPLSRGFSYLNRERMILYFLIIILFCAVIYMFINNNSQNALIKDNKNQIESLEKVNDSILKVNLGIEKKFSTFEYNIKTINDELYNNENEIKKLKLKTNEKIDIIDSYNTANELEQFFSKRYGNE